LQGGSFRLIYLGIAASAAGVLLLEIGLTRIFSYTIWYHFAYLTISVALLGFGASGSLLTAYPELRHRRGFLSWSAIAAQVGTALCLLVVDRLDLDPLSIATDPAQFAILLAYYLAVALPFLAGGFLVAGPLMEFPERVSRLYFWDLVGAGLACACIVPLIWLLGTPTATASSALVFGVAAWAYADPPVRVRQGVVAGLVALGVLLLPATSRFQAAPSKEVSKFLSAEGADLAYQRWTPINRVDVVRFDPPLRIGSYINWGISPRYEGEAPPYYMIGNDGTSCAVMYGWDRDPDSIRFLRHHVLRLPYVLLEEPEVVAIGMGGGVDVLNALLNGVRSIVAVEINPMTVHAGKAVFNDFNGDILNHPRVQAVVAEGRSFLRSRDDRYDLIEINSVDTLSALSTGAYVLSESFLYTADAVGDYLDHLQPMGIFAMVVGDLDTPQQPPRHTLRLASVVRRALEERGVKEPWRHVMVVSSPGSLPLTHTLVRNEPFGPEDVARVAAFAEKEGFRFWHRPDRPLRSDTSRILTRPARELEGFYDRHPLNLESTTDDSPFFFNFYKWRTLLKAETYGELGYQRTLATGQIVLVVMLMQSIVFASLLILLPLRRVPRGSGGTPRQRRAFLGYFIALGLGFILLEISFIQRFVLFLGYPTYSLTVVLFSLLVFTGIGSYLTDRIHESFESALPRRLGLLLLMVGAYLFGLPLLFDALLGAPLPVRVLTAIGLLAPLGLVLGSFFPLGIRILERTNRQLVPWGWAVNGSATVVGTILAVMMGMTWSFTVVTLVAMAVYTVGILGLVAVERARVGSETRS
jgi:hypothetical protein